MIHSKNIRSINSVRQSTGQVKKFFIVFSLLDSSFQLYFTYYNNNKTRNTTNVFIDDSTKLVDDYRLFFIVILCRYE